MRIEIERKKLVAANSEPSRIAELACLMTLCNMETAHKFLAYKSAFTLLYKMNNFITAAHFARLIVALETQGVSLANKRVDFCSEARDCATVQKVFLGVLSERNKCPATQVRSIRQRQS